MKDETTNDTSDAAAIPPPPTNEGTVLPDGKLPPELLEWALGMYTEEEILAGLEEVRKTGGLQFSDFIHELEQAAADD